MMLKSQRIRAEHLTFSDDAWCYRNGCARRHSTVRWAQNNSHVVVDIRRRTNPRITVWFVTHENTLLRSVFLEGTLKAARNLQLLEPDVYEMPLAVLCWFYFRHDGPPRHFAGEVRNWLDGLDAGDKSSGHQDPRSSCPYIFSSGVS